DAQYKRMLMEALDDERLAAVRLGVAGHNLFDVAFAHLLMLERQVTPGPLGGVEFEMLAGMAPAQQAVVREATGTMRLYVPVVAPQQFDVAVSDLGRQLEETSVRTHRDQDRSAETARGLPELGSAALPAVPGAFRNTPDTDVSTAANQEWADLVTRRIRGSELGIEEAEAARVEDLGGVEE